MKKSKIREKLEGMKCAVTLGEYTKQRNNVINEAIELLCGKEENDGFEITEAEQPKPRYKVGDKVWVNDDIENDDLKNTLREIESIDHDRDYNSGAFYFDDTDIDHEKTAAMKGKDIKELIPGYHDGENYLLELKINELVKEVNKLKGL